MRRRDKSLNLHQIRHNDGVSDRVLGVLGGKDVDDVRLMSWASTAHTIYAADSGADRLIRAGYSPIVVGDFDSFTMFEHSQHLRLEQDTDEDRTDCDKLLALAEADGLSGLTLTCVEGDLPDHVIATLSSVAASRLRIRIAFRRGIGEVVRPLHPASVYLIAGQRVSLVPLVPCLGVRLTGARWPLDGARIDIGGRLSVSNEAKGEPVVASIAEGCALLFYETEEVVWE